MYAAKRSGRNRAVRWDQVQDAPADAPATPPIAADTTAAPPTPAPIPYHAVNALISALTHRDAATAAHCQRVADLCVAVGRQRLAPTDCYVLEVAALLHDIGKLGVPD